MEVVGTIVLVIAFIAMFRPNPLSSFIQHAFLMTPAQMSLVLLGFFVGWVVFIVLTKFAETTPEKEGETGPPQKETLWDRLKRLFGSNRNVVLYTFLFLCILIVVEPYLHRVLRRTTAVKTPLFEAQLYLDRKLEISKIDMEPLEEQLKMVPRYDFISKPFENGITLCDAHISKIDYLLSEDGKQNDEKMEIERKLWEDRKKYLDKYLKYMEHFEFKKKIDGWEELRRLGVDREIIRDEVRCFVYQLRKKIESDNKGLGDLYPNRDCLLEQINDEKDEDKRKLSEIGKHEFYPLILALFDNYTNNVIPAIERLENHLESNKKEKNRWNYYTRYNYFYLSVIYMFNKKYILEEISCEKTCEYSEKHLEALCDLSREKDKLKKFYQVHDDNNQFDNIIKKIEEYEQDLDLNILFTKNNLAFLYAENKKKESLARKYIQDLEDAIEKDPKVTFFLLDTIGYVKYKFAKKDSEYLEAVLTLEEAIHWLEKAKKKPSTRNFLFLVKNHYEEAKLAYQPGTK